MKNIIIGLFFIILFSHIDNGFPSSPTSPSWKLQLGNGGINGNLNIPKSRQGSTLTYCEGIDRAILYGGESTLPPSPGKEQLPSDYLNDVWMLRFLPTWSWTALLANPGVSSGRTGHRAVYLKDTTSFASPTNSCHIVIHGGFAPYPTSTSPLLTLPQENLIVLSVYSLTPIDPNLSNLTSWSAQMSSVQLEGPIRPSARSDHVFVHMNYNRIYMFAGDSIISGTQNFQMATMDAYFLQVTGKTTYPSMTQESLGPPSYSFTGTWQPVYTGSSAIPPRRRFSSAVGFPHLNLIAVYGGESNQDGPIWIILSDFWILDVTTSTWTQIPGVEIKNTMSFAIGFENYFFWFGGSTRVQSGASDITTYVYSDVGATQVSNNPISSSCNKGKVTSLWCIMTVTKAETYDLGTAPGPRMGHSIILRNESLISFGGEFQNQFSDIWVLDLTLGITKLDPISDNYTQPGSLTSTVYFIIALMALLISGFVVFIMVVFIRRRNLPSAGSAQFNTSSQTNPGARRSLISNLPMKTFVKGMNKATNPTFGSATTTTASAANKLNRLSKNTIDENDIDDDQEHLHDLCPICLCDYEDGDQLKILPCNHFFHSHCVEQWLEKHNACPMCKRPIDFLQQNNNNNNNNNTPPATLTVSVSSPPLASPIRRGSHENNTNNSAALSIRNPAEEESRMVLNDDVASRVGSVSSQVPERSISIQVNSVNETNVDDGRSEASLKS